MSFRDFFSFNGKLSSKKFWCYLLILCGVSWFVLFIWWQYLYSINKGSIDSYFVFLLERFVFSLKWSGLVIPPFVDSCFDFFAWRDSLTSASILPILVYSIACFVFFANLLRRRLMDIENGGKLLVSFVSFFLIRVILFDILPALNNDIYEWEYWEVLSIFLTIVLNGLIIAIGFKKSNTNIENQKFIEETNRVFAMTFQGRATRATMWRGFGIQMLIMFVLILISGSLFSGAFDGGYGYEEALGGYGLILIFACFLGFCFLPVFVRRFHDLEMSGWWYLWFILLGLIPFVGWIAGVVELVLLYCIDGKPYTNKYGPDPKGRNMPPVGFSYTSVPSVNFGTVVQTTQSQNQSSVDNLEDSLNKLSKLKEQGIITEEEYQKKRAELISKI